MLKRIKNAYHAFWQPDSMRAMTLDEAREMGMTSHNSFFLPQQPLGDGHAAFLGEGTEEEFLDQQRDDKGMKSWYERIKRAI